MKNKKMSKIHACEAGRDEVRVNANELNQR